MAKELITSRWGLNLSWYCTSFQIDFIPNFTMHSFWYLNLNWDHYVQYTCNYMDRDLKIVTRRSRTNNACVYVALWHWTPKSSSHALCNPQTQFPCNHRLHLWCESLWICIICVFNGVKWSAICFEMNTWSQMYHWQVFFSSKLHDSKCNFDLLLVLVVLLLA